MAKRVRWICLAAGMEAMGVGRGSSGDANRPYAEGEPYTSLRLKEGLPGSVGHLAKRSIMNERNLPWQGKNQTSSIRLEPIRRRARPRPHVNVAEGSRERWRGRACVS